MLLNLLRQGSHFAATAVVNCGNGATCDTGLPKVGGTSKNFQNGLEVTFAVIAVISVVMVAIGGLQFILSQGEPQGATRARQTIIYAVVGLGIAITSEAIIAFVLNKLP